MSAEHSQLLPRLRDLGSAKTVGLISDTHVPVRAKEIPKAVFTAFQDVDFIIHAGDMVRLSVIDELEELAPVLAVYGNMDGPEIRGKLPKSNSVKLFDWKIGVMHDPRTLLGMGRMREVALRNGFNALIYGHTHSPNIKWDRGILFMNPGSPTNPIPPFITRPSVGLLKVTKEKIVPEIVQI
jgi:putative phosphoesterase